MLERNCILNVNSSRIDGKEKIVDLSYCGRSHRIRFRRIPGEEEDPIYSWYMVSGDVEEMVGKRWEVAPVTAFFARLIPAAERAGLPVSGLDISAVFDDLDKGRDIQEIIDELLERRSRS